MTNPTDNRYVIEYEATGNQPGRPWRQARFKTRYAAEKAIHRLESDPEDWKNICRRYPAPDYNDESWTGAWGDIGIVGVATFIYDDRAGEYEPLPVRLMVEDDEGLAEAWLTVSSAEQVHERLGAAIQRAQEAIQRAQEGRAAVAS